MSEEQGFWDSSALTALFVTETISTEARTAARWLRPVIWWGATVEVRSAFARLRRAKHLSDVEWRTTVDQLVVAREGWREITPSEDIRQLAVSLLDTYPLRAADSLQLAAALAWCDQTPSGHRFVCQDERLSEAAKKCGFVPIRF